MSEIEMEKSKILRLKKGDQIVFGNSMWTVKCSKFESGTVLRVTERGGILVEVQDEKGSKRNAWVPYHHVVDVEKVTDRP